MPRVTINAGDVGLASVANDFAQLTYDQPRNGLINGSFEVWQRGTSSLSPATGVSNGYTADRWQTYRGGFASGILSSRVDGYGPCRYGVRVQRTSGNTSTNTIVLASTFESANSKVYAGQQVTLSLWVRRGANYSGSGNTLSAFIYEGLGQDQQIANGFTSQTAVATSELALTTDWQRFSITGSVTAAATQIAIQMYYNPTGTAGANDWFEVTGAQLEIGAKPSPFQMQGGSLAAEIAACQRYYYRTSTDEYGPLGMGNGSSSSVAIVAVKFPTTMRTKPTAIEYSNVLVGDLVAGGQTVTSMSIYQTSNEGMFINVSGPTFTPYRPYSLLNGGGSGYLGFSAEI